MFEPVGFRHVSIERGRVELREHVDAADVGVQAVLMETSTSRYLPPIGTAGFDASASAETAACRGRPEDDGEDTIHSAVSVGEAPRREQEAGHPLRHAVWSREAADLAGTKRGRRLSRPAADRSDKITGSAPSLRGSMAVSPDPREEKFFSDFQAMSDEVEKGARLLGEMLARSAELGPRRTSSRNRAPVRLPDHWICSGCTGTSSRRSTARISRAGERARRRDLT